MYSLHCCYDIIIEQTISPKPKVEAWWCSSASKSSKEDLQFCKYFNLLFFYSQCQKSEEAIKSVGKFRLENIQNTMKNFLFWMIHFQKCTNYTQNIQISLCQEKWGGGRIFWGNKIVIQSQITLFWTSLNDTIMQIITI